MSIAQKSKFRIVVCILLIAIFSAWTLLKASEDSPEKSWIELIDQKTLINDINTFNTLKLEANELLKIIKATKSEGHNQNSIRTMQAKARMLQKQFMPYLDATVLPQFIESAKKVYSESPESNDAYVALAFTASWVRTIGSEELSNLEQRRTKELASDHGSKIQSEDSILARIEKIRIHWTEDKVEQYRKRALNLILKYHSDRKEVANLFDVLGGINAIRRNGDFINFAEAIATHSTDRSVRGIYAMAYAEAMALKSKDSSLSTQARAHAREESQKYARMVLDDYADIPSTRYGRVDAISLGEQAKGLVAMRIGDILPAQTVTLLSGELDQLSNYKGKVVLIDFWATWCRPCVMAIPELHEFKQEMEGRPFEIISVSVDGDGETVVDFQEDTPMPWVNWLTGLDHQLLLDWFVVRFPTYYLIDDEGVLQSDLKYGDELKELARKLTAEAEIKIAVKK